MVVVVVRPELYLGLHILGLWDHRCLHSVRISVVVCSVNHWIRARGCKVAEGRSKRHRSLVAHENRLVCVSKLLSLKVGRLHWLKHILVLTHRVAQILLLYIVEDTSVVLFCDVMCSIFRRNNLNISMIR